MTNRSARPLLVLATLLALLTLAVTGSAGAQAQTPAAITFYFAEGHIGDGFSELLNLANFSGVDGRALIHYTFAESPPIDAEISVLAGTTRCIALGPTAPSNCGREDRVSTPKDVSVKATTPHGWVVDRQMYFNANGWTGGHEQVGTMAPATTWYFAEGTTLPEFTEYLTLQNPSSTDDAQVAIDYLTEGCSGNRTRNVNVARQTRATVDVKASLGDTCTGVSAVVRSVNSVPIVAERPLYFVKDFKGDPAHPASDGHDVFGVNEPARTWYFAEGTTLPDFNEYIALSNPNRSPTEVTLHYFTDTSLAVDKQVTVAPSSRYTVEVFNPDRAGGLGPGITGVSVKVDSSLPVLAERPIYMVHEFPNGQTGPFLVTGGHDAQGLLSPGRRFEFVGATTILNTADYLTIQNPAATGDAHLSVRYTGQSGPLGSAALTVPAHTRSNIEIFNPARGGLVPNIVGPIGIVVESDAPVLVEQPSYFNLNQKDGATDVAGFTGPRLAPPVLIGTSPRSPANANTISVSGTAAPGSSVRLFTDLSCSSSPIGTATAGADGAFAVVVSVGDNTTTTFRATATTTIGETSACSESSVTYVENSLLPESPTVTGTDPPSGSRENFPKVVGTAPPGTTVNVYHLVDCSGPSEGSGPAASNGRFAVTVGVSDFSRSQFWATATNGAGNRSACSTTSAFYEENSTPIAPPVLLGTTPASPNPSTTPTVNGTAEAGSTVRIYRNPACTPPQAGSGTASGGSFAIPVTVPSGMSTFSATATDALGNRSPCSTSVTYQQDSVPPAPPVLTGTTPASPNPSTTPTIDGTAEAGSTVRIYRNSTCTTSSPELGTASASGYFAIRVMVASPSTTTFWATATDRAGNISPCSTTNVTYKAT